MKTKALVTGAIAGCIISVPKGPFGLYVMCQTIQHGFQKGFITSLGCIATTAIWSLVVLIVGVVLIKKINSLNIRTVATIFSILFIVCGICLFLSKKNFMASDRSAIASALYVFTFTFPNIQIAVATLLIFIKVNPLILTKTFVYKKDFLFGVLIGSVGWYVASGAVLTLLVSFGLSIQPVVMNALLATCFILGGIVILIKTFIIKPATA